MRSGNHRIRRIIPAYDVPLVRAYSRVRFSILRQRFLDELGQYLPEKGEILDVGCGFGLFSLYYALENPQRRLFGVDLSSRRIQMARKAAQLLGVDNVEYSVGDAASWRPESSYDAIYLIDLMHHLPRDSVRGLVSALRRSLRPGGRLIVKDVDSQPAWKRWFTWGLDKLMAPRTPVDYWSQDDVLAFLRGLGFRVHRHAMVDFLPYPHVIYICSLEDAG